MCEPGKGSRQLLGQRWLIIGLKWQNLNKTFAPGQNYTKNLSQESKVDQILRPCSKLDLYLVLFCQACQCDLGANLEGLSGISLCDPHNHPGPTSWGACLLHSLFLPYGFAVVTIFVQIFCWNLKGLTDVMPVKLTNLTLDFFEVVFTNSFYQYCSTCHQPCIIQNWHAI